jgi:KUP system potassium uptake protein
LRLLKLSIGAVGVVYGDIGTSPLYAMRECFHQERDEDTGALIHGILATESNVLGILSLFFWSLTVVIVVKYLIFVLRADNQGEGGTLALMAAILPKGPNAKRTATVGVLILLALFGSALLFGEGIITPAISVLSAVEGLAVANHALEPAILPLAIVILIGLFAVQRFGTGKIGLVFGLVMVGWFASLAIVGAPWITVKPEVLLALSPHYAARFFWDNGFTGFALLGSVVLCITGGEALYADMGHFGRRPIRLAWFLLVYPALLINYFGQGAFLLANPTAYRSPFYSIVPRDWLYPMIALATVATVVASQALISGAFSIARQAVQLGYFPRVTIIHTSGREEGQIYIPELNELMMVGCLALVVGFGSSSALAAAYGAAVTGAMTITSILFYAVMKDRLRPGRAFFLMLLFLAFDIPFLAANALKIDDGGWLPIALAVVIFSAMTTWYRGRQALGAYVLALARPLDEWVASIRATPPVRVPGTAVILSSNPNVAPPVLLHHLKYNKALHERLLLVNLATEKVPEIPEAERTTVEEIGEGIWHVTARYGFIQTPNVPAVIDAVIAKGVPIDRDDLTYYLGRETLLPTGKARLMRWRKRLFMFLARNSRPPTYYFRIPADRVVEIGMQIPL